MHSYDKTSDDEEEENLRLEQEIALEIEELEQKEQKAFEAFVLECLGTWDSDFPDCIYLCGDEDEDFRLVEKKAENMKRDGLSARQWSDRIESYKRELWDIKKDLLNYENSIDAIPEEWSTDNYCLLLDDIYDEDFEDPEYHFHPIFDTV